MKKILIIAALIAISTFSYSQETAQDKTDKAADKTKSAANKVGSEVIAFNKNGKIGYVLVLSKSE